MKMKWFWALTEPIYQRRRGGEASALRTEDYFRERAARGNVGKTMQILKKAGKGQPPVPGDELL
jgi:hypothetical protein